MGYRFNTFCECVKEEDEVYYDEYDDIDKDDPYDIESDDNKEYNNFAEADEKDFYDTDEYNDDTSDDIDALSREEDKDDSNIIISMMDITNTGIVFDNA